jgi:hypothetical protein
MADHGDPIGWAEWSACGCGQDDRPAYDLFVVRLSTDGADRRGDRIEFEFEWALSEIDGLAD